MSRPVTPRPARFIVAGVLGLACLIVPATLPRTATSQDASAPAPAAAPAPDPVSAPSPVPAPASTPALATSPPPRIDLDSSFLIPKRSGDGVSHIPAVLFTRDGRRLVTGTSEGEVIVWDSASRKMLSRSRLSASPVVAMDVDAEGKILVFSCEDGTLEVRRLGEDQSLARLEKLGAKNVALSPDGKLVALSRGAAVEVRRVQDLSLLQTAGEAAGEVTHLAWFPDGKSLAASAQDGLVRLLSLPGLATIWKAEMGIPMFAVAAGPDGRHLAFGGQDQKLYQVEIGAWNREVVSKNQPFWITSIGYSPDGKSVAIGDESCDVWIYDLASKECIFHSKHHVECWLNSVAWSPDGETFLFGCRPNAHAGKPGTWGQNTALEARNDPGVQQYEAQVHDLTAAFQKLLARDECKAVRDRVQDLLTRRMALLAEEWKRRGIAAQPQAHAAAVQADGYLTATVDPAAPTLPAAGSQSILLLGSPPAIGLGNDVQLGWGDGSVNTVSGWDGGAAPQTLAASGGVAGQALAVDNEEVKKIDLELKELNEKLASLPEVRDLRTRVAGLRKEQQSALQAKCDELTLSFCINQWKLKR
ncbi:MAG: hypothetical protein HYZ53_04320 [Planctomycetes bacterium]|nr:hypothetical protein [Planctomycetota bacterium]